VADTSQGTYDPTEALWVEVAGGNVDVGRGRECARKVLNAGDQSHGERVLPAVVDELGLMRERIGIRHW
jgi:hypothetical protein